MKKTLVLYVLILYSVSFGHSQDVNGVILSDSNGLTVIKVWGNHQERGYAYGFLAGEKIRMMFENYIKPAFGTYYGAARNVIAVAADITVAPKYHTEAQGVIDGMNAAGVNTSNLDSIDVLVGNAYLDISAFFGKEDGPGCSSLMDWGEATAGTGLDGKSVISRHLDWSNNYTLVTNQVMVIHLPSEPDEQEWLLVGFAGMISALSGINSGMGVFQHMMNDFSGTSPHGQHYCPVWFAAREALEMADFNNDGYHNVQDARSVLEGFPQGFADGYIITALASSSETSDTLKALVAEIAPQNPFLTFRYNTDPDSIPGDNLYAANYQIKRNNMMHFCTRYNAIKGQLGDGTGIGLEDNWEMMRDFSCLSNNVQFMQFAPELDHFRLAVYYDNQPGYMNDPVDYSISELFEEMVTIRENPAGAGIASLFYDLQSNEIRINMNDPCAGQVEVKVIDIGGRERISVTVTSEKNLKIPAGELEKGMYVVTVSGSSGVKTGRFVR